MIKTCPKCGAGRLDQDRFSCGTWNCVDDDRNRVLVESELCKSRAQLAQRDREIERLRAVVEAARQVNDLYGYKANHLPKYADLSNALAALAQQEEA